MSAQTDTAGLAAAAQIAGYAPSVHNTQPWRWLVRGHTLELWAVRQRQLPITDPLGRLLTVSCGTALQHARLALAAEGWQAEVTRLPDPDQPDLLARIVVTGRTEVTPAAKRLIQTAQVRHTDRRPLPETPVDPATVDELRATAAQEGAHLHVLRPDDVIQLAGAASRAQRVEDVDPSWAEELSYWTGGTRDDGLGLPDAVIPSTSPSTTVPGRNFGPSGTLPVGPGHDKAAVYAILYGDEDSELGWLRAGEALSATWLVATERDLTLLPLSATVEVPQTRQILINLLANIGEPVLVIRLGAADPDHAGLPHTPRLPSAQTIDIVE
jgi:nitroreductase